MELVIASTNRHKYREIRALLSHLKIECFSLSDFPHYIPPEEKGKSFKENALFKAIEAAKALQKWVVADDSGLVVPALQGRPGIYSRRYAGENATDLENRRKLLQEMRHLVGLERDAYYECSLAVASPEGLHHCVTATCQGSIGEKEKGNNGFGYDALFIKYDYNQTFAQLDESVKNQISHRAKAYARLLPYLESVIISQS